MGETRCCIMVIIYLQSYMYMVATWHLCIGVNGHTRIK